MKYALIAVAALMATGAARAETAHSDLSFLAGEWTIADSSGAVIGSSAVEVQSPGAVLFEKRRIGEKSTQPLWFVNSETAGGWKQLFVGVNGLVREFTQLSAGGDWPLILAGDIVLRDGTPARFRMTLEHASGDESRRVLEMSTDDGETWKTIFDYIYRRK